MHHSASPSVCIMLMVVFVPPSPLFLSLPAFFFLIFFWPFHLAEECSCNFGNHDLWFFMVRP
uniref:Uncharacterized protein n=1 Tax=Rhizophora mucronata TaxID=61149 RepID=A0A2P2QCS0_RHIMU